MRGWFERKPPPPTLAEFRARKSTRREKPPDLQPWQAETWDALERLAERLDEAYERLTQEIAAQTKWERRWDTFWDWVFPSEVPPNPR